MNRRQFLARTGASAGLLGLAAVEAAAARRDPLAPKPPHHPPRAKAVIWVFPYGAPGPMDTFDHKPKLKELDGTQPPAAIPTLFGNPGPLMASPFRFEPYGQCGAMVSEIFANVGRHADDLCILKSLRCDSNIHGPAVLQMNTGMTRVGSPAAGAWLTYGLGSAADNLPGFVVMYDRRSVPVSGPPNWGSGYLPAAYQGTPFRPGPSPVVDLQRQPGVSAGRQRAQLDLLRDLAKGGKPHDEYDARIESFELAFRMQMAAPEAIDLSQETTETKALYGIDHETTRPAGEQLLVARRLVERGVRVVQVFHGGTAHNWDSHSMLDATHRQLAGELDRPVAGLLADLKRRGMLTDTLVVFAAEFGRLPVSQDRDGRDHNTHSYCGWLAGGGTKGGYSYGETDDIGYKVAENPMHVNDFHATLLHLMGLDHEKLTFMHDGRPKRLTDVAGKVAKEVLA